MIRSSLQLRLLIGATVAIFVALAVAWIAMTWLFERHIERREAADLIRSGLVLAAGLNLDANGAPRLDQAPKDERFNEPAGGLYWQVSTKTGLIRSRSLWDQALVSPSNAPSDRWRAHIEQGAFGQRLLVVERMLRPEASRPAATVQVAIRPDAVLQAQREFGRELAVFLTGLWVVLSGAALFQVRLGLQPLGRLQDDVQQMRRNASARLAGDYPQEVEPLVYEINSLADARQSDVERARRRAADLAHSLKTPLSAMAAQSRRAREAGARDAADGLDRAVAAMSAALETELARARAAAARASSAEQSCSRPAEIVERLLRVIERTDDGSRLLFTDEIPPALEAPAPRDAIMEIFGALIENAARHARRQVRISGCGVPGGGAQLRVEDDGPGLDERSAAAALIRGGRLDEAGPGHGLGLAIVRDLVEATGGVIELGRSPMGGLQAEVRWERDPGLQPARHSRGGLRRRA